MPRLPVPAHSARAGERDAQAAVCIASARARPQIAYTVGTLVTSHEQYAAMRASFAAAGFSDESCEYLYIDNSQRGPGQDQVCAYRGLNAILTLARGRHIVLCHQDVRLAADGRTALDRRLADLDRLDPAWALAGNAGGIAPGRLALRISDPFGPNQHVGPLPARVMSLDENFIVVRRDTRVGFSRDLAGFHLYGADICLIADLMGHSAYVIDFHIHHLSAGNVGPAFAAAEAEFRRKWSKALRPRWVQTTCTLLRLSGGRFGRMLGQMLEAPVEKLARRLPRAQGWQPRLLPRAGMRE